ATDVAIRALTRLAVTVLERLEDPLRVDEGHRVRVDSREDGRDLDLVLSELVAPGPALGRAWSLIDAVAGAPATRVLGPRLDETGHVVGSSAQTPERVVFDRLEGDKRDLIRRRRRRVLDRRRAAEGIGTGVENAPPDGIRPRRWHAILGVVGLLE